MEAIEGRKVTRFRGSLILKVASATLIPVAVAAGLGFFWEYREDRNAVEALILHEMREEALALAAAIGATREQADLQTIVSNFLRSIGADSREEFGGLTQLGLSKVFAVDAGGVVLAGGRPEIIGQPIMDALGHGPMGLPAVLGGRQAYAAEFTVGNGRKVVHISVPLRIDRQDPARVTGAVHLMEPYALMEEALLPGIWRRTSVAVALVLALVAALSLILGLVVVVPVRRLAEGMRRAQEGLDVTVPVTSRDEIGNLTRSFNEMVADLHRKRGTLATLYAIDRTVSQSLDLEVVLTQTLEKVCEVMAVEAGGYYLLEPDGETMVLRVHRGLPSTFAEAVRRIRVGEGVSGQAIALRRPVAMVMADYPTPRLAPILVDLGIKHMASAPIISRERIVGAINVGSHRERPFTEEELDLIGSIGQQVGASVENARLYEAARREISDRQRAEEEVRKLARFPSENPNPILRVSNDGVILYANEASESLLRDWKCSVGNPVPEVYRDVVRDVVVHRSRTTLDVQSGDVVYSLVVVPILDAGYVNLYGRDITERKRAEQALATHTSQLEAIRAVTAEITRELNLPTVLGLITRQAAELVGATVGEISLWDEAAKVLIPQTGYGLGEWRSEIPIGLGEGIAGTVAQSRKGLIVNDYPASPYTLPFFLARGITAAIGEPLLYGDRLLGALVVGNREVGRPFTEQDRETLALFAHQAAIAIDNARLYQAERRRATELQAVAEVSRDVVGDLPLEPFLQDVVRRAVALTQAHSGTLYLWDSAAEVLIPRAWVNLGDYMREVRYRMGQGITGTTAAVGRGLIWNDYANDPRRDPQVLHHVHHVPMVACMAAPLPSRDRLIGVLTLNSTTPDRRFSPADLSLLETFAHQMAAAVENARLHDMAIRRAQQLETLNDMTQVLTTVLHPAEVAREILAAVQVLIPGATGRLWGRVGNGEALRLVASVGLQEPEGGLRLSFHCGEGLTGIAATTREPVISRDVTSDPRFVNQAWARAEGLASCIILPLLSGERVHGALAIFTRVRHVFSDEEVSLLRSFAAQAAIAIENARLFEQIRAGRDRLERLSQRLVSAQEEERRRLSRELHDEAGQALIVLKITLELIRVDVPAEFDSLRQRLSETVAMTEATMEQIRRLAQNLRPPGLDAVGLDSTLEGLCQDFAGRTRLSIRYVAADLPALPDAVTICLYRFLQEALVNVLKHAQANLVHVALRNDGQTISLSVEDDGLGFDVQAAMSNSSQQTGIGLMGLRERFELLGGRVRIESQPGQGTHLAAHVPWKGIE